jgi:hypothetical protein
VTDVLVAGHLLVGSGARPPQVDAEVRAMVGGASVAMVNLAGPVTETARDHVVDLGFRAVTLAPRLHLDDRRVLSVGSVPLRVSFGDRTLTVLGFGPVPSGAAAAVESARAEGGPVLVVVHGDEGSFPLPTPRLRNDLRVLAESGADAVVVHGPHVVSAYETWEGVPIFYGLGNFQYARESSCHGSLEGLLVGLTFRDGEPTLVELHPIVQAAPHFSVGLADGDQRAEILGMLEGHRLQVSSDPALDARWAEHAAAPGRSLLGFVRRSWSS